MKNIFYLMVLATLTFVACEKDEETLPVFEHQEFLGTWRLDSIYNSGELYDTTDDSWSYNPSNKSITFYEDSAVISFNNVPIFLYEYWDYDTNTNLLTMISNNTTDYRDTVLLINKTNMILKDLDYDYEWSTYTISYFTKIN